MAQINLGTLNESQQEAVLSEEKRLLVLAGAGSGKTKTLLQKIMYLTEEKFISPSEILAITFTKNAANEMIDRMIISADDSGEYEKVLLSKKISRQEKDTARLIYQKKFKWIDNLSIKTFHSFCYSILRNHGVKQFDNKFRIIGDEKSEGNEELLKYVAPITSMEVFQKLLIQLCSDTDYLLKLKRYILDYVIDKIHLQNSNHIFTHKDGKFFTALDGTKVRSKSEQFIADWFYRHSIKYEYEPELNIKDFTFRPDFYVPAANVYIEHVSNKSYPTYKKEEQFKKGKLLLIKTHEEMTKDSSLFNHTLDNIFKNRLPENYHSISHLSYNEEFNHYHSDVKNFVISAMRITDMIKVGNADMDYIAKKAGIDQHERVRMFYELALPLAEAYIAYCIDKSYLDFNDLITTTISLFKNHPDIANRYREQFKFVLVDEFQDVNNLQVEFIKLLIKDETQLFCVGDDWQSIYGFRGSNVSYIVEFENHFKNAKTIKLNLNYRSTQNIVEASNEIIKHNKFKVEKEVQSSKRSEHKIVVYSGNNNEDNIKFCIAQVKELLEEGIQNDEILFLYRRSKMFWEYSQELKNEGIKVQSKTIHAAKGLEAKVVFIIGLKDGNGGFPDVWLEDRIFQIIKPANHDDLLEEERRLFYVAVTRAKDKLFLLAEKGNESRFIKEIPTIYTVRGNRHPKTAIHTIEICKKCYSQLEKLWNICPYCGNHINK